MEKHYSRKYKLLKLPEGKIESLDDKKAVTGINKIMIFFINKHQSLLGLEEEIV